MIPKKNTRALILLEAQLLRSLNLDALSPTLSPNLLRLTCAAVLNVRNRKRPRARMTFAFEGSRYVLRVTSLGRVLIDDRAGAPLCACGFGELWD